MILTKVLYPSVPQALREEVDRLTDLIDTTQGKESLAIHLCRRGAVYRKVLQTRHWSIEKHKWDL